MIKKSIEVEGSHCQCSDNCTSDDVCGCKSGEKLENLSSHEGCDCNSDNVDKHSSKVNCDCNSADYKEDHIIGISATPEEKVMDALKDIKKSSIERISEDVNNGEISMAEATPKKNERNFKILLIAPRYSITNKKDYDYYFPMGLGYISAVLKKAGYHVDCLNLNHFEGTIKDIVYNKLDKEKYDFVGTGNMGIGYFVTETIINSIKAHKSNPKIILGGWILTSEPEVVSMDLNFDYGIIDEGEESVLELLEHLENNKNLSDIKGVVYFDEDRTPIITEKRRPPKNLDAIPFPDFESFGYEEWLNNQTPNMSYMNSIFDEPRMYPFVGSRSCPYQCTFCYHFNSHYRARSINNMMEEINMVVKKYKINRLYLYDELFAFNRDILIEFCNRINELRSEISWPLHWIPTMKVSIVDPELLKILKNAGCDIISYGFESASDTVLESMQKKTTSQQIENARRWTLEAGIALQGNFIFGDIAETKETAYETLNYVTEKCEGQVNMNFIIPYPDSKMYRYCLQKGLITDRLDFVKNWVGKDREIRINMTEKMSDEELDQLGKDFMKVLAKHRKVVEPLKVEKTGEDIYDLLIECPYCKKTMTYKNFRISNIFDYGYGILCRECPYRFHVASKLRKWAYKHFDKTKKIKDIGMRITNFIGKRKL